ncbi:mRNA capping enzyme, alpha subunit [Lophiostoma macrostomum CBS 122681]|nr:mRNA capping enzyme, alpha subunit [Lophiostoma macrostomum CBS 122681]
MSSSAPPQIPGTQVPPDLAEGLKKAVADLLGRESTRFPGAQPVSFAREHVAELQRQEYFMAEKTDGVRCLLYLTYQDVDTPAGPQFVPATFLIDRKNNYYNVDPPVKFPYFETPFDQDKFLFNTVLDGELVHDKDRNNPAGPPLLNYYVFDCLAINSQNYTAKPLDKRIGALKMKVFGPYRAWWDKYKAAPGLEPFGVKEKPVYTPYSFSEMFTTILPKLPHGNDGLVFTCKGTRYQFGTDKHILKWKPPQENTIDFKLKLGDFPLFDPEDGEDGLIPDYEAKPNRLALEILHNNNRYEHFTDLYFTTEDWEVLKSLNQRLDGRIIECHRDPEGRWRFKKEEDGTPRWRDDKKDANHVSTVNSVLDSINNPVTEKDLLDASATIREAVHRLRAEDKQRMIWQQQQQEKAERDAKKRKFSEVNGHG